MKSKIATLVLALGATLGAKSGFSQEVIPAIPLEMKVDSLKAKPRSFTYFRLQTADQELNKEPNMLPGLGVGYRHSLSNSLALDVSANYNGGTSLNKANFITLPKASLFHYVSPDANSSFYYGAGLGYGFVKVNKEVAKAEIAENTNHAVTVSKAKFANFKGLVPSATIGVEMGRTQSVKTFLELTVSQPTLRISSFKEASFKDLPRPIGEFSLGFGY